MTTTRGVPTVRPISWVAAVPQFIVLVVAIAIGCLLTRSPAGAVWGSAAYLAYSFGSRQLIARHHRRGIRLNHNHLWEDAIHAFQESYDFFSRHSWIDRYRAITMLTPAAMSYREMALINAAFAYSQLGDGKRAKEFYARALDEFPESIMARTALKMIESVERTQKGGANVT